MSNFTKAYRAQLKKDTIAKRKVIDSFEKTFGKTSEEMVKQLQNEPDYKKKLTVAETIWMTEFGQYRLMMDMLSKG